MTREQELEIIEKRKNKVPIKDILNEYNIKRPKTIYDIIKRNGIKRIANKKYEVNENYFEKIDNEEKAYWLGFLYADGYVRLLNRNSAQLKLKLQTSDKSHIEYFKKCIGSTNPIKDSIDIFKKDGRSYKSYNSTISIYNKKIVKDLISNGCFNNKTQKIRLPKIEENLIYHFIRGYFDGDGSISKIKKSENIFSVSICSNKNFIQDLHQILGIGNMYDMKNYSLLIISKMLDIKKFRNLIYENANIYLERKYKKFYSIIEYSDEYYSTNKNNFKKNKYKI